MSNYDGKFTHGDGITLKEFFVTTCRDRMGAHEKALNLARDEMNHRLEGMNEFRSDMQRMESSFMTRSEYEAKHMILESKIEMIQKLVYIGVGVLAVFEIALRYLK